MTATTLLPQVLEFVGKKKGLLIDGKWVGASTGKTFGVENPATGEQITSVAEGTKPDIDKAVLSAHRTFTSGSWRTLTASERGRLLWKLADLLEKHADEFAQLESLDNGKPYHIAKAADVPLSAEIFRYMAGWATKVEGKTFPLSVPYTPDTRYLAYTLKEPIGVVGQIIPWNFPLLMAAWKLAPALAAGCTVVLKPAEQTPLTALRLGELILEAGFPEGVVNIVTGFGEAGAVLAEHPLVSKVAFTGSTEVGKLIVKAAAGNLKKVSLELGGKSPNIIFEDADLEVAIPGVANAIFFNHGQCCCAGSRLYVQDKIYDKVIEGISKIAKTICVGDAFDSKTEMGPLISGEQLDRVSGYIHSGVAAGACVTVGGMRVGNKGYFIAPTVLTNTHHEMDVVKEEIFGPVVAVMPFKTVEEVIQKANDSTYGLAGGIWTQNITKAHRVSQSLQVGTTWINCYNIFDAALPFGGYKESGWGREMGYDAIQLYTETKAVCLPI